MTASSVKWLKPLALSLPFLALGLLQLVPYLVAREHSAMGQEAIQRADRIAANQLDNLSNGWKTIGFEAVERSEDAPEGRHSRVFELYCDATAAESRVSLDYPFIMRWHNLTGCYEFTGWECIGQKVISADDHQWPYLIVHLRDNQSRRATLFYSLFDPDGVGIQPPEMDALRNIWHRLQKKTNSFGLLPTYFQVQLFSLGMSNEEELLKTFLECRERIRGAVSGSTDTRFTLEHSPKDAK